MNTLLSALDSFGRTTGDYWSKNNAEFEANNPIVTDRIVRAINPMTSFGSALGAMKDAASNGFDPRDTAIALLQALPSFGAALSKTAVGVGTQKAGKVLKDITLPVYGANVIGSVVAEEYQAKEKK